MIDATNPTNLLTPVYSSKANGKLLLSGEYMVLKGAKALSIPLKYGQLFKVYECEKDCFCWKANFSNGESDSVKFNDKLTIISCSDDSFAKQVQKLVRYALKISDINIKYLLGKKILTQIDFLPGWEMGGYSSLVYNLACYLNIDPYELLERTHKGCGYDIANTSHLKPIFFVLLDGQPRSVEINFNPSFSKNIYFIYIDKKYSPKKSVKSFLKKNVSSEDINRISTISTYMAVCNQQDEFQSLMDEHEEIMGRILEKTPIKQKFFNDFEGSIKSLETWNGDFVMAVTHQPAEYVKSYFHNKNSGVIFNYNDIV